MSAPLVADLDGRGWATGLAAELGAEALALAQHRFPDGEAYVRLDEGDVAGRTVVFAAGLDHPDAKLMPLLLAADAARELGAAKLLLATPYLPYMRQDTRFKPGEAVAARSFARLLSSHIDGLATVDPHLHRIHDLGEVYGVPSRVAHAAPALADWIAAHVPDPVIVGPDEESAQWVSEVAARIDAPYTVFLKERRGDRDVVLTPRDAERLRGRTPAIVDDIVSTARTMIAAVETLVAADGPAPWCVGVHALFVGDAYAALQGADPAGVVTANTVPHASNAIDVTPALAAALAELL